MDYFISLIIEKVKWNSTRSLVFRIKELVINLFDYNYNLIQNFELQKLKLNLLVSLEGMQEGCSETALTRPCDLLRAGWLLEFNEHSGQTFNHLPLTARKSR